MVRRYLRLRRSAQRFLTFTSEQSLQPGQPLPPIGEIGGVEPGFDERLTRSSRRHEAPFIWFVGVCPAFNSHVQVSRNAKIKSIIPDVIVTPTRMEAMLARQ